MCYSKYELCIKVYCQFQAEPKRNHQSSNQRGCSSSKVSSPNLQYRKYREMTSKNNILNATKQVSERSRGKLKR